MDFNWEVFCIHFCGNGTAFLNIYGLILDFNIQLHATLWLVINRLWFVGVKWLVKIAYHVRRKRLTYTLLSVNIHNCGLMRISEVVVILLFLNKSCRPVISSSRRGVNDFCVFCFITQQRVAISYRPFGTTYLSHLQRSSLHRNVTWQSTRFHILMLFAVVEVFTKPRWIKRQSWRF